MSRFDADSSGVPQEQPPRGDAPVEQMPVEEPRRAASLTLRSDDVRESRAASMEAANKSLADALRITYRLIQVVMLALVVLFVFSGFQQVNQSESGIRVEFGKIKAERLEPGFQFSLPYPLGEIIKVETGNRTVEIDDKFWPEMRAEDRRRPLDQMDSKGSLEPGRDGSLLTGDSNIAHAQWSVVYRRADPADYIKNVLTDHENALVKAVVQRAAVQVAASVVIDELLKPSAPSQDGQSRRENSVETRVREIAQSALDDLGAGIEVSQVSLRLATPPLAIRRDFNQVQIAQAGAASARDQALGERSRRLNEVAGSASQPLLDLIDAYEAAVERGDATLKEKLLASINDVLEGKHNGAAVELSGKKYEQVRVSGEVATVIAESQQYRASTVQQAQSRADTFRAKREQYRANPAVFITGEWANAMNSFLSRANVQQYLFPDNEPVELLISPDPEVEREKERQRYRKDVESNTRLQQMPK